MYIFLLFYNNYLWWLKWLRDACTDGDHGFESAILINQKINKEGTSARAAAWPTFSPKEQLLQLRTKTRNIYVNGKGSLISNPLIWNGSVMLCTIKIAKNKIGASLSLYLCSALKVIATSLDWRIVGRKKKKKKKKKNMSFVTKWENKNRKSEF